MEWTELLGQLEGQIKQKLPALDKLQVRWDPRPAIDTPLATPGMCATAVMLAVGARPKECCDQGASQRTSGHFRTAVVRQQSQGQRRRLPICCSSCNTGQLSIIPGSDVHGSRYPSCRHAVELRHMICRWH